MRWTITILCWIVVASCFADSASDYELRKARIEREIQEIETRTIETQIKTMQQELRNKYWERREAEREFAVQEYRANRGNTSGIVIEDAPSSASVSAPVARTDEPVSIAILVYDEPRGIRAAMAISDQLTTFSDLRVDVIPYTNSLDLNTTRDLNIIVVYVDGGGRANDSASISIHNKNGKLVYNALLPDVSEPTGSLISVGYRIYSELLSTSARRAIAGTRSK
jgi:hypothetical protein